MKSTAKILKIYLFVACLLCGACTPKPTAQTYIDQGNDLLEEGNYEEAIIAYTNALEIEEKNYDAYRGRAKSYENNNQTDLALLDYDVILQSDEGTAEDYDSVIGLYFKQRDIISADTVIRRKEERFGQESLSEKDNQILVAVDVIDQLMDTGESNNAAGFRTIFDTPEYGVLTSLAMEEGLPFLVGRNGKNLGIYNTNTGLMVFYGDMPNGIRSGTGYWMGPINGGFYLTYCDWENDSPNGEFSDINYFGEKYRFGTVKNGLYDGVIEEHIMQGLHHSEYKEGIPVIIDTITVSGETRYIISRNEIGSGYMSALENDLERKRGIIGFCDPFQ